LKKCIPLQKANEKRSLHGAQVILRVTGPQNRSFSNFSQHYK